MDEWVKRIYQICTAEFHSAIKEKITHIIRGKEVDLKVIMLNETWQTKKNTKCLLLFVDSWVG